MRVSLRWIANIRTATTPCLLAGFVAASLLASPAQAKTLRYASQDDPQTVDPHSANLLVTSRVVSQIYEPLVWRDDKWKPIPWLATSWQAVNDKTWRFKLRDGVKFHDGATLSADDVVFSTERALSPTSQMRTAIQGIVAAKKIDALTVEFQLAEPNPALLSHLTNFRIMNKAWAEKNNAARPQDYKAKEDTFSARNANGTGAFKLVEWSPDVRVRMVRHDDWWGFPAKMGTTNLTEVVMLPIKSPATRLAALVSGEVDIVIDPPTQDVQRLKRAPHLKVLEGNEIRVQYLAFDMHRDELVYGSEKQKNPFKDIRVRQAVYHAVDIDIIKNKVMRGMARPTGTMVTPEVIGYDASVDKRLPYDLAKAKKLLAEAGYPKGFDVTLDCGNNQPAADICQAVAVMLNQAGIRVKPNIVVQSAFFPKIEKYDTSFYLLSWGGGVTADSAYTLNLLLHSVGQKGEGDFNMGRWVNKDVDALIKLIRSESDVKKRDANIREALALTARELPVIPLHQQRIPWVMKKNVDAWFSPVNTVYFYKTRLN
ncbi:MAG: ABC transporter substrate-binding protein [Betaproteobacteria bacterium]|nr:ABC transporter substrate-binding protein [Betaproteobacteria bacterium]